MLWEQINRIRSAQPTLNLFPTENRMSRRALEVLGSELVSRYPGSQGDGFMYTDPSGVHVLYDEVAKLASSYFAVRHAFVQFLSGLHAMQSVITTVCRAGDRIMVMDPACGGHYATETICRDLGMEVEFLPYSRGRTALDVAELVARTDRFKPRLVYIDLSTSITLPEVEQVRRAIGRQPILCLDGSHVLGLLPGCYEMAEFWEHVDICTASTHKTFPGPQKAVVLTDRPEIAEMISARLPFRVSSGHTNSVAALGVTLEELAPSKSGYARAVVSNARALASALADSGLTVPGEPFGYTQTHQVWVAPAITVNPLEWGERLVQAGIRATLVNLPSHARPGLRIGAQELTRVGMQADEMSEVAELLCAALDPRADRVSLRARTAALAGAFPEAQTFFRDNTETSASTLTTAGR